MTEVTFDDRGLVVGVVQDARTKRVLMVGYLNRESLRLTEETGRIHFWSRSRDELWEKGATSGNYLYLVGIEEDCDGDALLISATPDGPTCHKGTDTCWGEKNEDRFGFLSELEEVIRERRENSPENSYVASLFDKGINKIAQKVGEEAVEVVIEAKDDSEELFLNESADLLFHYLILLQAKGYTLSDIVNVLKDRHR